MSDNNKIRVLRSFVSIRNSRRGDDERGFLSLSLSLLLLFTYSFNLFVRIIIVIVKCSVRCIYMLIAKSHCSSFFRFLFSFNSHSLSPSHWWPWDEWSLEGSLFPAFTLKQCVKYAKLISCLALSVKLCAIQASWSWSWLRQKRTSSSKSNKLLV